MAAVVPGATFAYGWCGIDQPIRLNMFYPVPRVDRWDALIAGAVAAVLIAGLLAAALMM